MFHFDATLHTQAAVNVVLASGGYPAKYPKGDESTTHTHGSHSAVSTATSHSRALSRYQCGLVDQCIFIYVVSHVTMTAPVLLNVDRRFWLHGLGFVCFNLSNCLTVCAKSTQETTNLRILRQNPSPNCLVRNYCFKGDSPWRQQP